MLGAIIVSFLAGISVVLARTLNAGLAKQTGPIASTVYNYIVGILVSGVVLAATMAISANTGTGAAAPWWAWTGGLLGVLVTLLLNITVQKISSFYMTLLLFVGQVFTSILLDVLIGGSFSLGSLLGGLLVAAGLAINVLIDKQEQAKE